MSLFSDKTRSIASGSDRPSSNDADCPHCNAKNQENIANHYVLYIIVLLADTNFLMGGIIVGWPQSALPQLLSVDSSIPLTYGEGAWIVGITYAGMLTGGIICLILANRYGAKKTMLLASLPAISGWTIIAIASTYWELLVGRLFVGIFIGMCGDLSESYIAELSPPEIRGRLCATCSISIHIGLLMAFTIGSSLSISLSSITYLAIYVAYLAVFAFLSPETPFWYARQGNYEKVKKSLTFLRRTDNVEHEYEKIVQFVTSHTNSSYVDGETFWTKVKRISSSRENRRAIILVVLLQSGQQFSGIQAINTYAEILCAKSVKAMPAKYVSILLGSCELFFTVVSTMVMDTFGRKFLFTASGLVSATLMGLMGIYFHLQSIGTRLDDFEYLPIACVLLFAVSYSLGLSSVVSVVAGECFSSEMRITGMSIKSMIFCIGAMTVTKMWQVIASAFGDQYSCWTLTTITYLHVLVIYYVQPETKGKTLAEIQVILSRPWWTGAVRDRDERKMIITSSRDVDRSLI